MKLFTKLQWTAHEESYNNKTIGGRKLRSNSFMKFNCDVHVQQDKYLKIGLDILGFRVLIRHTKKDFRISFLYFHPPYEKKLLSWSHRQDKRKQKALHESINPSPFTPCVQFPARCFSQFNINGFDTQGTTLNPGWRRSILFPQLTIPCSFTCVPGNSGEFSAIFFRFTSHVKSINVRTCEAKWSGRAYHESV